MNAKRPRVLFVGAFPPADRKVFGGMVTSCRALLRSSLPEHLDLDLLDSTQIGHPLPPFWLRALLAMKRFLTFLARFVRHRPDAVLLFTAIGASVVEKGAMAWYARMRGVPALIFPRGGPLIEMCQRSRFTRAWVRFAFRGARMVLCQGPTWQTFACETLGFDRENAPIVSNWTATDELLSIGRLRQHSAKSTLRLLFVGWMDREKGVAELLTAVRNLASKHRFQLIFVGEGNWSSTARAYVKTHELDEVVLFRGWLDGSELHAEYAAADVFVLPSWSEGLPNAMIEAMAANLAVVVSAVGNVPDVVNDGSSALLVPPRDENALAIALAQIIGDTALRRRIAGEGFAIAEQQFGVETAVSRISAGVRKAMQRRNVSNTNSTG